MLSVNILFEEKDFKKIHGHKKYGFESPEAYFHNFATHDIKDSPEQTPGYQHCARSGINSYQVDHIGNKHGINKEYALGHGPKETQWFKFTKKLNNKWYNLSSGVKVDLEDIPSKLKGKNK